jgi:hypothetical protein
MFIAVCAVPFQQAFTIPVGFPLKISEVAGMVAVVLYAFSGSLKERKYVGASFQGALVILVLMSTAYWLLRGVPRTDVTGYERGLDADLILYCSYALMVAAISWFAGTRLGPEWIARGFCTAVKLAGIYCLVQVLLYLSGSSQILEAVSGTIQTGSGYGFELTRNGPFLEGNYLGFFAGVSVFLSWLRKDELAMVAAVACLLYSQSTIALVGLIVGLLAVAVLRPEGRFNAVLALLALAVTLVVTFVNRATVFVMIQLGKLGIVQSDEFGQNILYSMDRRSAAIERSLEIARDFPWLGVGPGRYGYWDDFYGAMGNSRGIANNAYAQILSEEGVVAVLCFIGLLVVVFVRALRALRSALGLAVFVIVGLSASPSWTVLPIWFAIAFLATCDGVDPVSGPLDDDSSGALVSDEMKV